MDADGLPLVGPGVDYTKVEAIHQKRTLAFLNHFISHTAGFLNRFSCVCEEKLEHMSSRLQQLEITMNILEAKLSSIPGLENVTAPASSSSATQSTAAPGTANVTPTSQPQTATADQAAPAAPPSAGETEPPAPVEEAEKTDNPVSKDPRYARFFKLVSVGVPEGAVRQKMVIEGLDPDYLSTPDAPAPPDNQKKTKKDSDSDDFSDDDSDESDFSD